LVRASICEDCNIININTNNELRLHSYEHETVNFKSNGKV
jgi:hypothetical protein